MSRIGSSFRADFHMVPPFVDENSLTFHLQIHGEDVYRSREISGNPATVFDLLQVIMSVKPLGYQFKEPARDRIGRAIAESIRRFPRKIQATADGKRRKKIRTETWIKLSIKPEEINFNQTIIFLCPLFSRSELKYFK